MLKYRAKFENGTEQVFESRRSAFPSFSYATVLAQKAGTKVAEFYRVNEKSETKINIERWA